MRRLLSIVLLFAITSLTLAVPAPTPRPRPLATVGVGQWVLRWDANTYPYEIRKDGTTLFCDCVERWVGCWRYDARTRAYTAHEWPERDPGSVWTWTVTLDASNAGTATVTIVGREGQQEFPVSFTKVNP